MDDLTKDISCLELNSGPSSPSASVSPSPIPTSSPESIETAFQNIINHVRTLRYIPDAEITGTKDLARPFTPGGMVFFLLEPLDTHPWKKGTRAVVDKCRTLDALAEGLYITSGGQLDLIDDVTVIDLWAFMSKSAPRPNLVEDVDDLHDLVFEFLDAKQPDVILGMGNEVKAKLRSREFQFPPDTKIVYAYHPGRSLNHEPEDLSKRQDLFAAITEAVGHLSLGDSNASPGALRILNDPAKHHEHYPEIVSMVIHLLRTLEGICFADRNKRPKLNLTLGNGYYRMEPCHIRHLNALRRDESGAREVFRGAAAKMFLCLSGNIKLTSWFLDSYTVD